MRIFASLGGVLVLFTAISVDATAIAQPTDTIASPANETLAEKFEQAYFDNSPNFFRNRSIGRQLDWMFGLRGFVENEISRDAKQVDSLYQSGLKQQVSSDPAIRTRDLPNPYETSILSSPNDDKSKVQNEVIFERQAK